MVCNRRRNIKLLLLLFYTRNGIFVFVVWTFVLLRRKYIYIILKRKFSTRLNILYEKKKKLIRSKNFRDTPNARDKRHNNEIKYYSKRRNKGSDYVAATHVQFSFDFIRTYIHNNITTRLKTIEFNI